MAQYLTTTKRRIRHRFSVKKHKGLPELRHIELLPPIGETLTVKASPSTATFHQTYLTMRQRGIETPEHLVFLTQELAGNKSSQRLVIYSPQGKRQETQDYTPSLTYEVLDGYEARNLILWTATFYSLDLYPIGSRHKRETVYLLFEGIQAKIYNSHDYPKHLEIPGVQAFMEMAQSWMGMLTLEQLRDLQASLQTRMLLSEAAIVLEKAVDSTDPLVQHQAGILSSFLDKDPIPEELAQQTLTILRGLL